MALTLDGTLGISGTPALNSTAAVTSMNGATGALTDVSSLVAGNGITVSGATGAVTVSLDIYQGTARDNTSYPIGTYYTVWDGATGSPFVTKNQTQILYIQTSVSNYFYSLLNFTGSPNYFSVAGTWRSRGVASGFAPCTGSYALFQRVA